MTQNNGTVFEQASTELIKVLENSRLGLSDSVERAGKRLEECLLSGGTIFTCGNGGSATDAIHLAEELIGSSRRYANHCVPFVCVPMSAQSLV